MRSAIVKVVAVLGIALSLTALPGMGATSHAQNEARRGLSVSPPTLELSANPGDSLKNTIRVTNVSETPLEVGTDIRNFTAMGDRGQVRLDNEENDYSLAKWMSVAPQTATLAPGESKEFTSLINIPSNGQPGGHFGSVVFSTKIPEVGGSSGATVGQEVATLVLLRVAGDAKESLNIDSFATVKSADVNDKVPAATNIFPSGPIAFDALVKNNGNVYLKPKGVITITDVFGRTVKEIPLNNQNVLPEAKRRMGAIWKSNFLFGRYNAQLTLTYGVNNAQITTATTTFWVVPYQNLGFLGASGTGLLMALGLVIYRRRFALALKVLTGGSNLPRAAVVPKNKPAKKAATNKVTKIKKVPTAPALPTSKRRNPAKAKKATPRGK